MSILTIATDPLKKWLVSIIAANLDFGLLLSFKVSCKTLYNLFTSNGEPMRVELCLVPSVHRVRFTMPYLRLKADNRILYKEFGSKTKGAMRRLGCTVRDVSGDLDLSPCGAVLLWRLDDYMYKMMANVVIIRRGEEVYIPWCPSVVLESKIYGCVTSPKVPPFSIEDANGEVDVDVRAWDSDWESCFDSYSDSEFSSESDSEFKMDIVDEKDF